MKNSSPTNSNLLSSSSQPLNSLNSNTMQQSRHKRHSHTHASPLALSIIDSHLVHLHAQLANLNQQYATTSSIDSSRLKALLDAYHYSRLQLEARFKIEEERINRRYDAEIRSARAQFATKKSEFKEILLDRLRRKRKLVVDDMKSVIDIHSRSFDADPLLVTMQPPHPLQAKAYNFRQRPDMGQQNPSSSYAAEDEYSSLLNMNNMIAGGILSPMPPQQAARKRLVGAFSLFPLPRWTIKDEECEDDLRLITNTRK